MPNDGLRQVPLPIGIGVRSVLSNTWFPPDVYGVRGVVLRPRFRL